jgi:holo-[acyl-carrier protein] synthase
VLLTSWIPADNAWVSWLRLENLSSIIMSVFNNAGTRAMIIGMGSDLCNIERIQASLDRFGERFEQRVFTPLERAKAARRPFTKAGTLAKRFAAKEAFSKAIGLGLRGPMTLLSLQVLNDRRGKPIAVPRKALEPWLRERGLVAHVSISDELDSALAFVVVEQRDER